MAYILFLGTYILYVIVISLCTFLKEVIKCNDSFDLQLLIIVLGLWSIIDELKKLRKDL